MLNDRCITCGNRDSFYVMSKGQCSNCDYNDWQEKYICPECDEHFNNGNHVTIGAMTTCYAILPGRVV